MYNVYWLWPSPSATANYVWLVFDLVCKIHKISYRHNFEPWPQIFALFDILLVLFFFMQDYAPAFDANGSSIVIFFDINAKWRGPVSFSLFFCGWCCLNRIHRIDFCIFFSSKRTAYHLLHRLRLHWICAHTDWASLWMNFVFLSNISMTHFKSKRVFHFKQKRSMFSTIAHSTVFLYTRPKLNEISSVQVFPFQYIHFIFVVLFFVFLQRTSVSRYVCTGMKKGQIYCFMYNSYVI